MKNSGEKRPLTPGESALARSVFGDQLNCDKITIHNRKFGLFSFKNGGRVFCNTLNVSGTAYCRDFSKQNPGLQAFFIHELTHIWQYQKDAVGLAKSAVKDAVRHNFNYHTGAYKYRLDAEKSFADYGHEQQASMVQDYFLLSRYNLGPVNPRCQNSDLSVTQKLALYEKLLAPHFLFVPSQQQNTAPPKSPFKP